MAVEPVVEYGAYSTRPSALLNSIFMSTVNRAAKTLVAVASTARPERAERWKAADHMRFMVMLMTWLAVWVLRVLMDHFPCSMATSDPYLVDGFSSFGSFDLLSSSPSSSVMLSSSFSSDIVLQESYNGPSPVKALGRALTHILALLNEIPASSRKYQFAVAMADKIVDENARNGHLDLLQINRTALASSFARTSSLLYRSIQNSQAEHDSPPWTSRVLSALPLGSYLASYLKGLGFCFGAILPSALTGAADTLWPQKNRQLVMAGESAWDNQVVAEKHAQELLWITNKMRACGAVDEALLQWSLASGLASISLTANPRVQGFIVKITAILFGELTRANLEVAMARQVKFRLLVLWLPLFCYADNGLAYPVLTGYERGEMERIIDHLISSLPAIDQEIILTNWLQDYTISASDWPNLQISYDRWCQSTRKFIT